MNTPTEHAPQTVPENCKYCDAPPIEKGYNRANFECLTSKSYAPSISRGEKCYERELTRLREELSELSGIRQMHDDVEQQWLDAQAECAVLRGALEKFVAWTDNKFFGGNCPICAGYWTHKEKCQFKGAKDALSSTGSEFLSAVKEAIRSLTDLSNATKRLDDTDIDWIRPETEVDEQILANISYETTLAKAALVAISKFL